MLSTTNFYLYHYSLVTVTIQIFRRIWLNCLLICNNEKTDFWHLWAKTYIYLQQLISSHELENKDIIIFKYVEIHMESLWSYGKRIQRCGNSLKTIERKNWQNNKGSKNYISNTLSIFIKL